MATQEIIKALRRIRYDRLKMGLKSVNHPKIIPDSLRDSVQKEEGAIEKLVQTEIPVIPIVFEYVDHKFTMPYRFLYEYAQKLCGWLLMEVINEFEEGLSVNIEKRTLAVMKREFLIETEEDFSQSYSEQVLDSDERSRLLKLIHQQLKFTVLFFDWYLLVLQSVTLEENFKLYKNGNVLHPGGVDYLIQRLKNDDDKSIEQFSEVVGMLLRKLHLTHVEILEHDKHYAYAYVQKYATCYSRLRLLNTLQVLDKFVDRENVIELRSSEQNTMVYAIEKAVQSAYHELDKTMQKIQFIDRLTGELEQSASAVPYPDSIDDPVQKILKDLTRSRERLLLENDGKLVETDPKELKKVKTNMTVKQIGTLFEMLMEVELISSENNKTDVHSWINKMFESKERSSISKNSLKKYKDASDREFKELQKKLREINQKIDKLIR